MICLSVERVRMYSMVELAMILLTIEILLQMTGIRILFLRFIRSSKCLKETGYMLT